MYCRIIALTVLVALLVTVAFTTTVHTFNPPEPELPRTSHYESIEPIPLEPVKPTIIRLSSHRSRLQLLRDSDYEPMKPANICLGESFEWRALDSSGYDAGGGDQDAINHSRSIATTCTVTTRADSGPGSLRQCLLAAAPGDTITFNPQAFPPTAPVTIALLSPLPWITTDRLTIDGSNAGVILDGRALSTGGGLVVSGADGITIRGLQILNFPWDGIALANGASSAVIEGNCLGNNRAGVWLEGAGTTGNQVRGNYIGTNATGTRASANTRYGVFIGFGAGNNVIGGDTPGARNLISGNGVAGVFLQNVGTTNNQVAGNYIGTDVTGTRALGNTKSGIVILAGASNNVIGGDTPGARNLISGNGEAGVKLQNAGTSSNQIHGNYIGSDVTGINAIGNEGGVVILGGASDNLIGGETPGARNLISGNGVAGVWLQDAGTTGNQVQGNYIGTDATGAIVIGNSEDGIFIGFGASNNVIGGDTPDARNLISGNGEAGVWLQNAGTSGNQIRGNYIGTDTTGTIAIGNSEDGIFIGLGTSDNLIGGETPGAGNLISGNGEAGVWLQNAGTTGNQVQGNYIGTDATGTQALRNNQHGIFIGFGVSNNVIGGDTPSARNLISGNSKTGVWLQDHGTTGNQIRGNYIGTDTTGTSALGNGGDGVFIGFGASTNVIGGDTAGTRNLISGNGEDGVFLQDADTAGNQVRGNYIGTNATGTTALPNGENGISLVAGTNNNTIGGDTPGTGNLISGNNYTGVNLQNAGTANNQVAGNYIGTDATGTQAIGNHAFGVFVGYGASSNEIGGEDSGARNLISGNGGMGVSLDAADTIGNRVRGNYIGTDATGTSALGNTDGVFIGDCASNNVIGGCTPGARNLISGNGGLGVVLQNVGTTSNQIIGNYIGTDVTGKTILGNSEAGILISYGASNNVIGGDAPGAGNLISGNSEAGVWLQDVDTSGNQVQGNYIGIDAEGTRAIGNGKYGVFIGFGARDNLVGGETRGAHNLISGNGQVGVHIQNIDTINNQVLGNTIGADATGTNAIRNGEVGVFLGGGANHNVIGGDRPGTGNLISGNGIIGVLLQGDGTSENQLRGNYIGTDRQDIGPIPNAKHGVYIEQGASSNTIGPNNTIAYNGAAGVVVDGETTLGNSITRNPIHHNGGLPIDFINVPVPTGPFLPPTLTGYSSADNTLSGSTCPNCRVEVFANPDAVLAGTTYLDAVTADANGDFTLTLAGPPPLPYVAATATDPEGTTSEFSAGLNTVPTMIYLPFIIR